MAAIEDGWVVGVLNLKAKRKAGSEEAGRVSEVQKQGEVRRCEAFLPSVLHPGGKEGRGGGSGGCGEELKAYRLTS